MTYLLVNPKWLFTCACTKNQGNFHGFSIIYFLFSKMKYAFYSMKTNNHSTNIILHCNKYYVALCHIPSHLFEPLIVSVKKSIWKWEYKGASEVNLIPEWIVLSLLLVLKSLSYFSNFNFLCPCLGQFMVQRSRIF